MEKLTGTISRAIQDKKGKNIVSLDLSKIDGAICSCFIVCNADSTTQVAAIAAGIEEQGLENLRAEGRGAGGAGGGRPGGRLAPGPTPPPPPAARKTRRNFWPGRCPV